MCTGCPCICMVFKCLSKTSITSLQLINIHIFQALKSCIDLKYRFCGAREMYGVRG